MAVEDRSLSEFPRALQVAEQALVMISNPDGLGGYDTNGAVLTEVGKALLNVQYTQQLGNVSVFDAIKNTRVLSGTATPLANEGANGQLYVKYQTVSNVDTVIGMYFKKDGAWLEISLGGGGGASVTLGTTVPSDASGDNGDLYVQYDSSTYAVVEYFVKVNDSWRIAPYSRVVSLTQAQYDLITPDPTTLYIITDAQSSYQTKSDNSLDTDNKTVVGAINEVNSALSNVYTKTEVNNLLSPNRTNGTLQSARADISNWNSAIVDLPLAKAYSVNLTFESTGTSQPSITHTWQGTKTITGGNLIVYAIDGNVANSGTSGSINSNGQLVWNQGIKQGVYVALGTLTYS